MAKNLVRVVVLSEEGLDQFEDELSLNRKRAKIQKVKLSAEETRWERENKVDEASIRSAFNPDDADMLMVMPPRKRLHYIIDPRNWEKRPRTTA